jgi:hypothetical protein
MATINPQTGTGNALTYAAATAGGDTVAFGTASRPVILVKNGDTSSHTVTLAGKATCNQGFTHSVAYTVAAGAEVEILPPPNTVDTASATRGQVSLTYDAVTSVSVAALAS